MNKDKENIGLTPESIREIGEVSRLIHLSGIDSEHPEINSLLERLATGQVQPRILEKHYYDPNDGRLYDVPGQGRKLVFLFRDTLNTIKQVCRDQDPRFVEIDGKLTYWDGSRGRNLEGYKELLEDGVEH